MLTNYETKSNHLFPFRSLIKYNQKGNTYFILLNSSVFWEAYIFTCTPLIFIPWHFVAIFKGLKVRTKYKWKIINHGALIRVLKKKKTIDINSVNKARYTYNDNWTESKDLDDGVNLYNKHGLKIIKIPLSAEGPGRIYELLSAKNISTYSVYTSAPSYF